MSEFRKRGMRLTVDDHFRLARDKVRKNQSWTVAEDQIFAEMDRLEMFRLSGSATDGNLQR